MVLVSRGSDEPDRDPVVRFAVLGRDRVPARDARTYTRTYGPVPFGGSGAKPAMPAMPAPGPVGRGESRVQVRGGDRTCDAGVRSRVRPAIVNAFTPPCSPRPRPGFCPVAAAGPDAAGAQVYIRGPRRRGGTCRVPAS
ncbi:hypothetical protein GCM10010515_32770 [Streptomyces fructofermentans]|uniref:Uncharacterized protein n=1 Tax=Streptomyces fructofermentans TaxID=152141 RepID=A0A918NF07_9ACTN|nr:hypothetical protein GCM10010515_32770 [Streptomyces fructofermentans]